MHLKESAICCLHVFFGEADRICEAASFGLYKCFLIFPYIS